MWMSAEILTDEEPAFGIWTRDQIDELTAKRRGRKARATKAPAKAHQRGKKHPVGCPHCEKVRSPAHRTAAKARAVTQWASSKADGDRGKRQEV